MSNYAGPRWQERASRSTPAVRQRGFTLLELITTVTVASIVLAIAVPSFFNVSRNSRAAANANELVSALSIARNKRFAAARK